MYGYRNRWSSVCRDRLYGLNMETLHHTASTSLSNRRHDLEVAGEQAQCLAARHEMDAKTILPGFEQIPRQPYRVSTENASAHDPTRLMSHPFRLLTQMRNNAPST